MKIELGDRVRCKISGFEGIVTSHAVCLTGCDRLSVRAGLKKDGSLGQEYWFDVPTLELIKKGVVKPESVTDQSPAKKVGGPPTEVQQR